MMEIPYTGLFLAMPDCQEPEPGNLYPFDGFMEMDLGENDSSELIAILASDVTLDRSIPKHAEAGDFGQQIICNLLNTLQSAMAKNHHRLACLVVPYGEMQRFSYAHKDFTGNAIVHDYMNGMRPAAISGIKQARN